MVYKTSMRVLSLGAGVQSSTLALMIERGELPMVDCAIFADTLGEGAATYNHLSWLKDQLSFPVHTGSFGDLKLDTINSSCGTGRYNFLTIPLFTVNGKTGKKGLLRRQCTSNYKINPVNQKVRELLGLKKGEKRKRGTNVDMVMGISYDEVMRMTTNRIKWITNVYPLIENKFKRADCIQWFEENYKRTPPRSACTFCPYKTNLEWQQLKDEFPNEFADVVQFDDMIRTGTKNDDKVYLHRSCQPLGDINFIEKSKQDTFDFGQLENCEGMCGV